MSAKGRVITEAARRVLTSLVSYDGARATITDDVGDCWQEVKTLLEILDAAYVRRSTFAFTPDRDAREVVGRALAAGCVWPQATGAGYVPTPASLAEELVSVHGVMPSVPGRRLLVLDPSAGTGRLVDAVTETLGAGRIRVTAVEPDGRRARAVEFAEHVEVVVDTFEAFLERALRDGLVFDLIVMNPPFSVAGHPVLTIAARGATTVGAAAVDAAVRAAASVGSGSEPSALWTPVYVAVKARVREVLSCELDVVRQRCGLPATSDMVIRLLERLASVRR